MGRVRVAGVSANTQAASNLRVGESRIRDGPPTGLLLSTSSSSGHTKVYDWHSLMSEHLSSLSSPARNADPSDRSLIADFRSRVSEKQHQ